MRPTAVITAAIFGVAVGLGLVTVWSRAATGDSATSQTPTSQTPTAMPAPAVELQTPQAVPTPPSPTPLEVVAVTVTRAASPTIIPAPRDVPSPTPTPIPQPSPTAAAAPPTAAPASPTAVPARAAVQSGAQSQIEAAMQAVMPFGSAELITDGGRLVAAYRAARSCTAASTIKLSLLIEVLRRQEAGTLDLSRTVTIRAQDVVGGTGNLQYQVGRTLTLQEVAHQMVLRSDNVAANILVDIVGMDSVNATAHNNGFPNTFFRRHLLDTAAQAAGVENVTTAEDLAGMLHRIVRGTLISPSVSQQALTYLDERGRIDKDWLGLRLPKAAQLSHINGTLAGVRDDVGLITSPLGGSFVLAVCQDHLTDQAAGEAAIAELARRVYDILDEA